VDLYELCKRNIKEKLMPTEKKTAKKETKKPSEAAEITAEKKVAEKKPAKKCTEYFSRSGTGRALKIRDKASSSGEEIGSIPFGEKAKVYSVEDGWAEVEYNGIKGYSIAAYLTCK
jgi:uncharacterized protein YgiM (DUF1202 family)